MIERTGIGAADHIDCMLEPEYAALAPLRWPIKKVGAAF
jgi:hypothetical protein